MDLEGSFYQPKPTGAHDMSGCLSKGLSRPRRAACQRNQALPERGVGPELGVLGIRGPKTTKTGGSCILALRPTARGIPETTVCRFVGSFCSCCLLGPYGWASPCGVRVLSSSVCTDAIAKKVRACRSTHETDMCAYVHTHIYA